MMQEIRESIGPLVAILVIVIAVLWIALPFAVFGIKKRLDAILVELRRLNRLDR